MRYSDLHSHYTTNPSPLIQANVLDLAGQLGLDSLIPVEDSVVYGICGVGILRAREGFMVVGISFALRMTMVGGLPNPSNFTLRVSIVSCQTKKLDI